jgi:hypothetical protein
MSALSYYIKEGARCSVVSRGTMQQAVRSRVRLPMRSLDFSFYLTLLAALWSWGRLSVYTCSYFPPKRRFTQDIHCATSQKTAFLKLTLSLAYNISARAAKKKQLLCCCVRVCCCGNVFIKSLPRNVPGISPISRSLHSNSSYTLQYNYRNMCSL